MLHDIEDHMRQERRCLTLGKLAQPLVALEGTVDRRETRRDAKVSRQAAVMSPGCRQGIL